MLAIKKPGIESQNESIVRCYEEVFPAVARYVHHKGGDLELAREIFQDALVIYYEKTRFENFSPDSDDKSYLFGIAKKLWLKHHAKAKHSCALDDIDIQEEHEREPLTQRLLKILKQSGEKCMDILQSYYYEKLNMKELADRYGYASERSATVQKYKCLEKVREEVKLKSMNYEDFFE